MGKVKYNGPESSPTYPAQPTNRQTKRGANGCVRMRMRNEQRELMACLDV